MADNRADKSKTKRIAGEKRELNDNGSQPEAKRTNTSCDNNTAVQTNSGVEFCNDSSESVAEAEAQDSSNEHLEGTAGDKGYVVPEGASDMPPAEDIQSTFRRLSEESKDFYSKWMAPFSDSDSFESLCPVRLDELLKEAYALEKNLLQQKEKLKNRLIHLSSTLDMMSHTIQ